MTYLLFLNCCSAPLPGRLAHAQVAWGNVNLGLKMPELGLKMPEEISFQWKAIVPAARRGEIERYRDFGMLRGQIVIGKTNGGTFIVRCSDERDALWLQLCYS
jgi:hypothetical protein